MMNDQTQIKIPWNGWRIVRRIGRGGFGTVYEIEREIFGKVEKAAMKVISVPESTEKLDDLYSSGLDDEGLTTWCSNRVESIVNEYMVMNRLKGKTNIVSCDDIEVVPHGNDPGADIFIRMELLTSLNKLISIIQKREENLTGEEKETLRKLRSDHKEFTDEDVIRLGKDITQALEICEKNDIVHRDIKPENILISDDGDFKLGDFGTARKMEHTTAATFAGTERYMAPEVIKGGKTGKDVDTYALGLVMYRLLNRGRFPFYPLYGVPSAEEIENAQRRRLAGEPFDPPVDGSPELKALVMKACAYDRKDRFASASEMMERIEALPEVSGNPAASGSPADSSAPEGDSWTGENDFTFGSGKTVSDSWEDDDVTVGGAGRRPDTRSERSAPIPAPAQAGPATPAAPASDDSIDEFIIGDVTGYVQPAGKKAADNSVSTIRENNREKKESILKKIENRICATRLYTAEKVIFVIIIIAALLNFRFPYYYFNLLLTFVILPVVLSLAGIFGRRIPYLSKANLLIGCGFTGFFAVYGIDKFCAFYWGFLGITNMFTGIWLPLLMSLFTMCIGLKWSYQRHRQEELMDASLSRDRYPVANSFIAVLIYFPLILAGCVEGYTFLEFIQRTCWCFIGVLSGFISLYLSVNGKPGTKGLSILVTVLAVVSGAAAGYMFVRFGFLSLIGIPYPINLILSLIVFAAVFGFFLYTLYGDRHPEVDLKQ